jgi:hypothetical protein
MSDTTSTNNSRCWWMTSRSSETFSQRYWGRRHISSSSRSSQHLSRWLIIDRETAWARIDYSNSNSSSWRSSRIQMSHKTMKTWSGWAGEPWIPKISRWSGSNRQGLVNLKSKSRGFRCRSSTFRGSFSSSKRLSTSRNLTPIIKEINQVWQLPIRLERVLSIMGGWKITSEPPQQLLYSLFLLLPSIKSYHHTRSIKLQLLISLSSKMKIFPIHLITGIVAQQGNSYLTSSK